MSKTQPDQIHSFLFTTLKAPVKKAGGNIHEGGAFPDGFVFVEGDFQASGGRKGARKLFEALLQKGELYTYVGMATDGNRTFCTPNAAVPMDGFCLVVSDRSTAEANLEAVREIHAAVAGIGSEVVDGIEIVEINRAFIDNWLSGEGWKPLPELNFE